MAPLFDSARTRVILLDIEGTTTPISFVYRTLFPFAAARVEEFLQQHPADREVGDLAEQLRREREAQASKVSDLPRWNDASAEERLRSAAAYVRYLMEHDSKATPLKTLQGKIWEEGYRQGKLRGEVYPDVAPALIRWRAQGRRIAIFSSGSVLAQKLLFTHSTTGDLAKFIDAFFDTTTGPKREAASYRRIAVLLSSAPSEILFLSDVAAELDAASAAGMQTGLSLRPEVEKPAAPVHPSIKTFDEIFP
ncbi:MAG: acireductone synthase [Acidobacteriales bacterium]|nr:acireductone synthase [Terriglobales bacterium]